MAKGLIGPATGLTRVLVSHEPERAIEESDEVLRLAHGGRIEAHA